MKSSGQFQDNQGKVVPATCAARRFAEVHKIICRMASLQLGVKVQRFELANPSEFVVDAEWSDHQPIEISIDLFFSQI